MTSASKPNELNYGFIGAGNMASAMLQGLAIKGHPPEKIMASNPSSQKLELLAHDLSIKTTNDNQALCDFADVVIISVKPQKLAAALAGLHWTDILCAISVAAGTPVSRLEELINHQVAIVRSMPNTPATALAAATGVFAKPEHKTAAADIVDYFFSAFGQYQWIDDESMMDIVTAIAGSSPAYFFMIIESMIKAAENLGMEANTAKQLVVQSCFGAAKLIQQSPDIDIEQLRKNVTSPNGTTAAALASLAQDDIEKVMARAIDAAVKRGHELSQLS
ncbi:MAG: pyrroline-5-carboxylate reductase [Kangiellaceae bacterium]|jgi:pyrroline-5-carboxylate reductase|nr:pyrroline-5-carboxylate reductase [Kangiellaceae bacterium]